MFKVGDTCELAHYTFNKDKRIIGILLKADKRNGDEYLIIYSENKYYRVGETHTFLFFRNPCAEIELGDYNICQISK